jgi:uncharacterized membrane protein (UPF0127 family)
VALPELRDALTRNLIWLRRIVGVVLIAGLAAFVLRGADEPADPSIVSEPRRPLAGFTEEPIRVTQPSGSFLEWCALLAATEAARAQGLMDQTDLRGYDAMAFRHDAPTEGAFYMFKTRIPLSIAWFDEAGAYVSAADMEPCASADPGTCPLYRASRKYTVALEVPKGGLARLGIQPGSTLSFPGGACA